MIENLEGSPASLSAISLALCPAFGPILLRPALGTVPACVFQYRHGRGGTASRGEGQARARRAPATQPRAHLDQRWARWAVRALRPPDLRVGEGVRAAIRAALRARAQRAGIVSVPRAVSRRVAGRADPALSESGGSPRRRHFMRRARRRAA